MTDAINESVTIYGDLTICTKQGGAWVPRDPPTFPHVVAKTYSEQRPKSVARTPSASGWRSPTPWNHSFNKRVKPSGLFVWYYTNHVNETSARLGVDFDARYPTLVTPFPQYMEDAAINQALTNLSNQNTQLLENFAERQEAADMMGDRLRSVGQSVNDYKGRYPKDWGLVKRFGRGGRELLQKLPHSWLEVTYGWKPLLSDIYGAYSVLKHRESDGDLVRVTVKGKRGLKWTVDSTVQLSSAPLNAPCKITRFYGAFVRLDYRMVNPFLHQLQELGVLNPAAVAWNLVPYSFVVDWALPIGQFLSLLTADAGFSFLGGSVSRIQRCELRGTGQFTGRSNYHPSAESYFTSAMSDDAVRFTRRVFTASPGPRLPHWKNPLSLHHFANAMSLLVSAFS